jgi:UDP-N-acetylmuramate--alanine ligase
VNWPEIKRVYFIGIGGIGMSALARYCKHQGKTVSGYDRTETALTKELIQEGIEVHYTDSVLLADTQADLIVYTPAIPAEHSELNYFKKNNYEVIKRSDLLQQITKHTKTIAIGGTHGKTTTTSLIAHILRDSGTGCTAFLGGISSNYKTNFWISDNNIVVVEADEYDRSFLKLYPYISVITSCDADHLDIYKTHEALLQAFHEFASLTDTEGILIKKSGLPIHTAHQISYSTIDTQADVHAENIRLTDGYYHFDIRYQHNLYRNFLLHIPGLHNVENALAAIAVALYMGIDADKIRRAVSAFTGVKRRFEILVDSKEITYVDDYAHHPTELTAAIQALRAFKPKKKLTIVFQPHLFSRTRDFAEGFAKALSLADEVIMLPIYPAREIPIEGVNSEWIVSLIKNTPACVVDKKDLLNELKNRKLEVLCTLGAGDIDQFAEPIKNMLSR